MARNALANSQPITAAVSAHKANKTSHTTGLTKCKACNMEIEQYSWSKRQHRMIEYTLCLKCS